MVKKIKDKIKRYSKMSLVAAIVGFFGAIFITIIAIFIRRKKHQGD